MSDILSIGGSAIAAYQRALGTVSNNIANLNTEGYSRQDVTLGSGPTENRANVYLGTGVVVTGVKRAYSEFAANSLRSSFSSLNTQDPLVTYSNRIIDVMGSAKTGLTTALDQFFTSTRAVSAAPADSAARSQFLTSADGVAGRLRDLSGQLQGVETDTREEINAGLAKINTITSQLATLNAQLSKNTSIANQPPALLDQRDQLLTELSKIVGISVSTSLNGEVTAGLGNSASRAILVSGNLAKPLGAVFNDASASKVDVLIDPYGTREQVSSLDSGSIAGLISFRQQVLEPAQSQLDTLTQVFATEVNKIQTTGIDGHGQVGKPIYAFAPAFQLATPEAHPDISASTVVVDPAATLYHDIKLDYDDRTRVWTATDIVRNLSVKSAPETGQLTINGMQITLAPVPQGEGAITLMLKAYQRPASTIKVVLKDPMGVAAAALFRVTAGTGNTGVANATLNIKTTPDPAAGPQQINSVLNNNSNVDASISVVNPPTAPLQGICTIPAGFGNISVQLTSGSESSLNLQVFTRDGRQLLGTPLDPDKQKRLVTPQNGFVSGASFSADFLNKTGNDAYRKLDLFYGARALPGGSTAFDRANGLIDNRNLASTLNGEAIPAALGQPGSTYIPARALTLNGLSLGSLQSPPSGHLQASDLAHWINAQVPTGSDVVATASSNIHIQPGQIPKSASIALSINGVAIYGDSPGALNNANTLESAINAVSNDTGVIAVSMPDGSLNLSNSSGDDITIGTPQFDSLGSPASYSNALGLNPSNETPETHFRGQLKLQGSGEIRLGIGSVGGASDLAKLGFRAGAYINGQSSEDLLVFQTGIGTGQVAASYDIGSVDAVASQRAMPLKVQFTTADKYTITDVTTGQVVAERTYDSAIGVRYGTLTLNLGSAPQARDVFVIDGNSDGTGNNENILSMAALETRALMPQSRTVGEAYNSLLTDVGNVSSQAQIAQQAMTVVNQQAVQARDSVSGVNLDNEAADLIRFQQAYQAAAKTMQVATQLFDSILQIR